MSKTETIYAEDVSVSYTYHAGGDVFLFLFHGFGQTADVFQSFIPQVQATYSIIAFDLFSTLQDKTLNRKRDYISFEQWNMIIEKLCSIYSIQTFSVVSFSMGTRFAVSMLGEQAERIQRMVLIAPDGFGNTPWFRIATASWFTRKIFKRVMHYPAGIKCFAGMFHRMGLLNQITYRFIERNLETTSLTEKIYATWVYVRKLGLTQDVFVSNIKKSDIKILFILGRGDQLVASDVILEIAAAVQAQVIELERAHHKLTQAIEESAVKDFLIPDRK